MRRANGGPGFRSQRAKSLALSLKRRKTGRRARHFFDVPCIDDQRARVRKQDARITNQEKDCSTEMAVQTEQTEYEIRTNVRFLGG